MNTEEGLDDYEEVHYEDGYIEVCDHGYRYTVNTGDADDLDGYDLSTRHTTLEIFDMDFGVHVNDLGEDEVTSIGEVTLIPCSIGAMTTRSDREGYLLINLKHGASYWIKHSDMGKLYTKSARP